MRPCRACVDPQYIHVRECERRTPPTAPTAEPVAWLVRRGEGAFGWYFESEGAARREAQEQGGVVVPLYAHPPPPRGEVVSVRWEIRRPATDFDLKELREVFAERAEALTSLRSWRRSHKAVRYRLVRVTVRRRRGMSADSKPGDVVAEARAALEGVSAWDGNSEARQWLAIGDPPTRVIDGDDADVCTCEWEADASFIAAARTLVPALVEEVERLRHDGEMWAAMCSGLGVGDGENAVEVAMRLRADLERARRVVEAALALDAETDGPGGMIDLERFHAACAEYRKAVPR